MPNPSLYNNIDVRLYELEFWLWSSIWGWGSSLGLLVRFMILFNIRFMGIYALQLHAERQHINFMAIEARQKELQQQQQ